MNNSGWRAGLIGLVFVLSVGCSRDEPAPNGFAHKYFEAKVATQQPNATPKDLEDYLALLTDDVGYEHKPYRLMDVGEVERADGKQRMREGMTFYLGGNTSFTAKIENISTGFNAVAIQYSGVHEFRRGGEGPVLSEQYNVMEVLELVDGKVSIIREYQE